MATMELFPTLEHCIETTARTEYNRLISEYMDHGGKDPQAEALLELLHGFLVEADFASLRRESESYLLMNKKVRFTIIDKDNVLAYCMDVV